MTDPADIVSALDAKATRSTTPCGERGMVWRQWGDGPPLVLLHGGFGSWMHWVRNIEALAAQHTVFAPDLPGLGESDLPELNYTPENLSAALADGLDRTVPKPFDMAGFSTGGLLGGHAAARLGDKVRSLTLIGASGFGPIRRQTQQLTRAPGDGDTADAEATARRNLGILMFADKANIDDLAVHIHMQNLPRARVRSRRMALSDTLLRVLPDVVAPLNGIWGEHDTTLPPNIAERENQLRAIQPGLDFRVIDGAGHWVMYEAADAFNAALLDVLSRRREGST